MDDENRIVLSLKSYIAPYQVAILPLSMKLNDIAIDIDREFAERNCKDGRIIVWIDNSKVNIGRKYARCDQKGIPFAITIDPQTRVDNMVTLRERDSTLQIRIYIHDIYDLVNDLCLERKKWKSVINKYGEFKHNSISYRKVLSWLFSAPVIFVLCAIIIYFVSSTQ